MSAPIDLNERRRAILQAQLDHAQRLLAMVESNSRANAESVIDLRHFAEVMGVDSEQGRDALEFADRMERDDARRLAEVRRKVARETQRLRAELGRLP